MSMNVSKFSKYVLKVHSFERAQKLKGIAVKSRHGNILFTKMSCLLHAVCSLSIYRYSNITDWCWSLVDPHDVFYRTSR